MRQPFPTISPNRHLDIQTLAERFAALAPSPKDSGTVTLLLAREPERMRHTPHSTHLGAEGMPGDAWGRSEMPKIEEQLAVMNQRVGALVANGQSFTLFGDNLVLDLDLSAENLPIGSQLKLGAALVEVTPKAHTGCTQYAQRFGPAALRYISQAERRPLRLRGVYFQVVKPGDVSIGDPVEVLRRGP